MQSRIINREDDRYLFYLEFGFVILGVAEPFKVVTVILSGVISSTRISDFITET